VCFFSALTLLVGSFDPQKPVPVMSYNVLGGTLSLTQSINQSSTSFIFVSVLSWHPITAINTPSFLWPKVSRV